MRAFFEKIYVVLVFGELTTAIGRVFSLGLRSDTAAGHTSNPVLLGFNVLVVAGTFWLAFPRLPEIWHALLRLKWTFLLYVWGLASIAWSMDRAGSSRLAIYSLVYLLSAGYFAVRYDQAKMLRVAGRCMLALAILSVPGEFLLPPLDDPAPGWSGVFLQKNCLGLCMMIGIALLLVERRRWSAARVATLILYLALLCLSQSFTAMLGAAMIALFLLARSLRGRGRAALWSTAFGICLLITFVGNPVALVLDAGGKDTNFTGRDVVWVYVVKGIAEQPLIGHGYGGAFWNDPDEMVMQALRWHPHHAHNGFLEVWLDLGIVGLILVLAILLDTWRRARRLDRSDDSLLSTWALVLLLALIIHNLAETDLAEVNILWFLVMATSFACLRAEDQRSLARPDLAGPRLFSETLEAV